MNTIAVRKIINSSLNKSIWDNGVNTEDTKAIYVETGSLTLPSDLQGYNSSWKTFEEVEDSGSADSIVDISWPSLCSEYEGDENIEGCESADNFVDSSWCSFSAEYVIQDGINKKVCIVLSIGDKGSGKKMQFEDSHIIDFSEIVLTEDSTQCLVGKDDHVCGDFSEDFESLCNDSIKIAKQRKGRKIKNGL
jgi:hypothetical protein